MTNAANRQVVLVTGASSGMGKAFVKALLAEGMTVYAVARRVEQMQDLEQLGAFTMGMDITREADVEAVVQWIETTHGSVDVLINNAGFGMYGAMEDISIEEARYQFEVNLFGLARLTQRVLPSMRRKKSGEIINISSMGGKVYTPLGSWYHATKHALEGWSDCLRIELSAFNIDVVIIQPGVIETEFGDVMVEPMLKRSGSGPYQGMAQALAKATRASYSPGRSSSPEVITDLVLQAIKARKPKTRYAAGKYAKLMMCVRKWLGDRVFDKLVLFTVKSA
ncbi:SDR family NAD(P)-dependent oxidoreductase [Pseudomonas sp. BGM005]|nr:SDR family NAD(P)-dependent oxidoreductase [Pseudomonas sp. BG5]